MVCRTHRPAWLCAECSGTCPRAYAAHSGNEFKIEGINYSRNGDICAGVSGHVAKCNSNPAAGSFVYWTGSIYGLPVVSTDKGDLGHLAGHSY
jgi:hypothetical protein